MRKLHRIFVAASCVAASLAAMATQASAQDQRFFNAVSGVWTGPGEIVAGKYKGTKFNCSLTGLPHAPAKEAGVTMDGTCRVGVFTQKMSATITKSGRSYDGQFLDGADGKGLDVVSGRVDGDGVILGINRQQLNGAMVARLDGANTLNVTVSVKVGETMVPVIGMTLARDLDSIAVGSIE